MSLALFFFKLLFKPFAGWGGGGFGEGSNFLQIYGSSHLPFREQYLQFPLLGYWVIFDHSVF